MWTYLQKQNYHEPGGSIAFVRSLAAGSLTDETVSRVYFMKLKAIFKIFRKIIFRQSPASRDMHVIFKLRKKNET